MSESRTDAAALLHRMQEGITELGAIVRAYPDPDSWIAAGSERWSPLDVLAHIRASAEILTPRIFQMLVRDDPPLPAFDERRWAAIAGYHAMSPETLFARIILPRYELLQVLRDLDEAAWLRTGNHEEHGVTTIEAVVAHLVDHEEEHLAHLRRLLAAEDQRRLDEP